MTTTHDQQADFWNGTGGDAWVALQPVLDRAFSGFTARCWSVAAMSGR